MLKHVHPGDPLRIPAGDWNRIVDATRAHYAHPLNQPRGVAQVGTRHNSIIFVRNDTGEDQPRSAVLGLAEPIILPGPGAGGHLDEFLRQPAFKAVVPVDPDHLHRFVVLLDPVASGAIGRAYASGLCPVQIDVVHESDTTAGVVGDDSTKLQSGRPGVPIVWKAPGTAPGIQWAVVHLTASQATRTLARVTDFDPATGDIGLVECELDGSEKPDGLVWDGIGDHPPKARNPNGIGVEHLQQIVEVFPYTQVIDDMPTVQWRFLGLRLGEVFRVEAAQVGGLQSADGNPCTWTYDLSFEGTVIATGVDPVVDPHDYRRTSIGPYEIATAGTACYRLVDDGESSGLQLCVLSLNEYFRVVTCPPPSETI